MRRLILRLLFRNTPLESLIDHTILLRQSPMSETIWEELMDEGDGYLDQARIYLGM